VTVERLSLFGRRARSDDGQDTTEYVLVIILLALAFTAGMMVWTRSVNGAYEEAEECIAYAASTDGGASRGTPRGWETGRGYGYGRGNGRGYGYGRGRSGRDGPESRGDGKSRFGN
jgi:hypothetical protein